MIDANETKDVTTCDIPEAFLWSDIDDFTLVVVDGELVDILLLANKEYAKFVHITTNGKKVIYLQLKKLSETVKAVKFFFENLTNKLSKYGFIANPYDSCVINMKINKNQCTVL